MKSVIKVGEKLESRDRGKIPPGTIVSLPYGEKFIVSRKMNAFGQELIYNSSGRGTHCLGIIENFTVEYLPPELPKVGDKIKLGQLLNLPPGSLAVNNYWRYWSLEDGHCVEQSMNTGYTSGSHNRTRWHMSEYPNETLTLIYINN